MSSYGLSGSFSANSGSFESAYAASNSAIASGSAIASNSAIASGSAIAAGSASAYYNNSHYAANASYAPAPAAAALARRSSTITTNAPLARRSTIISANAPLARQSIISAGAPLARQSIYSTAAPLASRQIALRAPLATNFAVPDNVDPNPLIIRKKPETPVNYTQQVSVKFLQPPPPQQPGDIVITQQKDVQAAPVAPRLIRQKPPLPVKPAPLVVRERPPLAPAPIAPEHHVIPGKVIPPPPRKVIIERLPQLPQPPQDIIVERWLEYGPRSRRVVFQPAPKLIPAPAPKNVLVIAIFKILKITLKIVYFSLKLNV